ncbi:MAG: BatD family protein [candidate division WOR-3 bacterium]
MRYFPVRYAWMVLLALFLSAAGAELNFSADVDRTTVGLGEELQLTVTVRGTNIGSIPRPQLPELSDFNNLGSTSSQSTNISFVNGRMTQEQTVSFIYFLSPKKVGSLSIGPCKLEYKGETYQTQPISITVTKESQAPPARQGQQPQRPFDPFDWDPFAPPQRQPRTTGRIQDDIHIVAAADRTVVYQGEQVTVSFSLYTRRQISDLRLTEVPSFNGFWVENLYDAKQLQYRTREYGGRQYDAALLKKVALFPTQSGELRISPMKIAGQAISSGGFFFQSAEPFEISSGAITVTVKPLPEQGKPASFTGGVGRFEVTAKLSADSSVGGEPLNLSVRISGTGNLRLIGPPKLPAITGVRVLNPETKDKTSDEGGGLSGSREFVFPLMPQVDGKHSIPSLELGFFDPKAGTYYTRSTPALEFVARGAVPTAGVVETGSGMRVLGSDIRHIKPCLRPGSGGWSTAPEWWIWLFYPMGIVVLTLGVVLGRHQRRLEQDRGYARRTRSGKLVKKRLAQARGLLEQGDERGFYAALSQAVVGYVGDRFNIESQGMTNEELTVELTRQGVSPTGVTELLDIVKNCDAARFSPGMVSCSGREMLERAVRTLEAL